MVNKKVCIIGSGIGGLAVGALLTKKGYKVTVFEKESDIGGRAFTLNGSNIKIEDYKNLLSRHNMNIAFSEPDLETIFKKKMLENYNLDLGFHIIGGGITTTLNDMLSEINENQEFIDSYIGFIENGEYNFPFISRFDKIKIAPNIIRLLFANERKMKELDKTSITDTIKQYGKGKMKLILEVFSRSITTINNLDKISSGEMLRAQKNLYRGSKPVAYPKGGLKSIYEKFANYIEENGGEIKLNANIDKIIIKDEKAIGVEIKYNKYLCDIVISNILVQNIFNIADENQFPKDYVNYIKSLRGTGSLCAYYSLNEIPNDLIGKAFHFIERDTGLDGNDVVGMIDFMITSKEADMSPKERLIVQSYVICTPAEAKNPGVLRKLRKILDENLEVLIPNFKSQLNWAVYPTIWHLDGVAKTIEKDKPEITSPVKNLYLVGDCVKAPGIGFNCALNSANTLNKIITENE